MGKANRKEKTSAGCLKFAGILLLTAILLVMAFSASAYSAPTKLSKKNLEAAKTASPIAQSYPTISACSTMLKKSITLNNDIKGKGTCLTVMAPNVTIDCAGHTITGTNQPGSIGIYSNQPGTHVRNCVIRGFQHGILFNTADQGSIYNVDAASTQYEGHGIYLNDSADYNTISNSKGTSTIGQGIQLDSSSYNRIVKSAGTSNSGYGIYLYESSGNTIADSTASSAINTALVLNIYSDYNNITNTNATSTSKEGIFLGTSSNNIITDSVGSSNSRHGIELVSSSNNNLLANSIGSSDSGVGIMFDSANNNVVLNTKGTSNSNIGLYLYSSTGNSFADSEGANLVSGAAGYGIFVTSGSHMNTFINTRASSAASSAIYVDGGSDVTIDCAGQSITGANKSGTYGIYSNQPGTTVRNCQIGNFEKGIYFNGVSNGNIQGVTASTSFGSGLNRGYGIYLKSSNGNTITGTTVTSAGEGVGLYLLQSNTNTFTALQASASSNYAISTHFSSNNTFSNSSITSTGSGRGILFAQLSEGNTLSGATVSTSGIGIFIGGSSSYNTIANTQAASSQSMGMIIQSSASNAIINSDISGNSETNGALSLESNAKNNAISGSTINGGGKAKALSLLLGGNTGNSFVNNRFQNAKDLVVLDSASGGNTFYWNSFEEPSGRYVDDQGGANNFSPLVNGQMEGNIYSNVIDGSVAVTGTTLSGYGGGLFVGDSGTGFPYNFANSGGMMHGATDFAPLTPYRTQAKPEAKEMAPAELQLEAGGMTTSDEGGAQKEE